ncbi:MAG: hypothetical protein WBK96_05185 [Candidatus Manganitrophaceae bacterium]
MIRIEPKHLQARISLGSLYADRKEFEKAKSKWEEASRLILPIRQPWPTFDG